MKYVRKNIRSLSGYVPGEQPGKKKYLKLNTNENPYPPSPRAIEAMKKAATEAIRFYPEPLPSGLIKAASKVYGLPRESILAGNGSDELLSIITRVFTGEGDSVVFPSPTYTLYETLVTIQGGKVIEVPFPDDFSFPGGMEKAGATVAFVANPNSPSGTLTPVDTLKRFARKFRGIVVVDEAYADFASENAIPLVLELDNLIVLRTFSKSFSLAGIRLGLAFASPSIIDEMRKVKDSYNLNSITVAGGTAALNNISWMKKNVRKIIEDRENLSKALMKLGFQVYPSQANFTLARMKGKNLSSLYEELKRARILVRYFPTKRLYDCLRITVGRAEEHEQLIHVLRKALARK